MSTRTWDSTLVITHGDTLADVHWSTEEVRILVAFKAKRPAQHMELVLTRDEALAFSNVLRAAAEAQPRCLHSAQDWSIQPDGSFFCDECRRVV